MLNFVHKYFKKKHCIMIKHLKKERWMSEDENQEIKQIFTDKFFCYISSRQCESIEIFCQ